MTPEQFEKISGQLAKEYGIKQYILIAAGDSQLSTSSRGVSPMESVGLLAAAQANILGSLAKP